MTNSRREERLEERRLVAQKKYSRKCATKVVKRFIFSAISYLIMIAAEIIVGFNIWNHFNPTADYLEFIAWVIIIGSLTFTLTYAAVEENFKNWYGRAKASAKIERRRINRFFSYEKRSLK